MLNEGDILFQIIGGLHLRGMASVVVWFCFVLAVKCQHTAEKKKTVTLDSPTLPTVNEQFCVIAKEADQIPAATAFTSVLYCFFVKAKTNRGNLVMCKLFSLCYWALRQRTMGLTGNKSWSSINVDVHTERVQLETH